jgi:hypothetical protein
MKAHTIGLIITTATLVLTIAGSIVAYGRMQERVAQNQEIICELKQKQDRYMEKLNGMDKKITAIYTYIKLQSGYELEQNEWDTILQMHRNSLMQSSLMYSVRQ